MTEDVSGTQSKISITLPELKEWSVTKLYDYRSQISDYEDLASLSTATNAARVALFRVTDQINQYERTERTAKLNYERAYRRAYLASMEKTEAMKKMRAELSCEALENEYVVAEQVKNELIRLSHSLRLELQTLQAVGNNLRQQMKMME